jgi:glycosyltransferase involved in cell wall biosynthesis
LDINWTSPITENTSYGIVAINIIRELLNKDIKVAAFPIGNADAAPNDASYIRAALDNYYNGNAPSIRLYHNFDLALHPGRGLKVGFSIWELDRFTFRERHQMNQMDAIACCSEWAVNILRNNGFTQPIIKIPLGVNRDIFNESIIPFIPKNPRKTVFINIGKNEVRKSHPELLSAFNSAFNTSDNVELIMLPTNFFIGDKGNKEWETLYKTSKLGNKIQIIPRLETPTEVARLMMYADCMVTPSKTEGWGLSNTNAMACGLHLITSDVTAHTEFCNNDNSKLINFDEMEPAFDGVFFDGKVGNWHKFGDDQMEQLIGYMREIHNKKQNGTLGMNMAGIQTSKLFSWTNSANHLMAGLKNL